MLFRKIDGSHIVLFLLIGSLSTFNAHFALPLFAFVSTNFIGDGSLYYTNIMFLEILVMILSLQVFYPSYLLQSSVSSKRTRVIYQIMSLVTIAFGVATTFYCSKCKDTKDEAFGQPIFKKCWCSYNMIYIFICGFSMILLNFIVSSAIETKIDHKLNKVKSQIASNTKSNSTDKSFESIFMGFLNYCSLILFYLVPVLITGLHYFFVLTTLVGAISGPVFYILGLLSEHQVILSSTLTCYMYMFALYLNNIVTNRIRLDRHTNKQQQEHQNKTTPTTHTSSIGTITDGNSLHTTKISLFSSNKLCQWFKRSINKYFGLNSPYLHGSIFILELIESTMQFNFLIKISSVVPSSGWLITLTILLTGFVLNCGFFFIPVLKHTTWTIDFVLFIDAFCDVYFIFYNLDVFQYRNPQAVIFDELDNPRRAWLSKITMGMVSISDSWEIILIFTVLIRLTYLSYIYAPRGHTLENESSLYKLKTAGNNRRLSVLVVSSIYHRRASTTMHHHSPSNTGIVHKEPTEHSDKGIETRLNHPLTTTKVPAAICTTTEGNNVNELNGDINTINVVTPTTDKINSNPKKLEEKGAGLKEPINMIIRTNHISHDKGDSKPKFKETSSEKRTRRNSLILLFTSLFIVLVFMMLQFQRLSGSCASNNWSDETNSWCKNQLYFPDGIFGDTGCICRDIAVPNCHNNVNKYIPDWIGDVFEDAVTFSGSHCNLVGVLPNSITQMKKLEYLMLRLNKLECKVPDNIGDLIHLKVLAMDVNLMFGKLPQSIGELSSIKSIYLGLNNFTGEIPTTSFQNLNLTLEHFHINENYHLTGSLPSNLQHFDRLKTLGIQGTNVTLYSTTLLDPLVANGGASYTDEQLLPKNLLYLN